MTRRNDEDELPVFVLWMEFLKWLLPVTEKFPRRVRFTFVDRIQNLALDLVEDLVEARYTREKRAILRRANLRLEKLRMLVRLSHAQRWLSNDGYRHAAKTLNQVGQQLGGWLREQRGRP